ncbi:hypothetical protein KA025_02565 [Candidatus Saccharibacteria bacterium]|jgi:hypothetical protein|nr:hypothetical protein [Candidatus Saccharibacteria bacterium]MBP7834947.1 hypothetical protein [Candidatus Saccharibacteria bacterium]
MNNLETIEDRNRRHRVEKVRSFALMTAIGAGVVAVVVNYVPNNFSSEPTLDQTNATVDTSQSTNSLRP